MNCETCNKENIRMRCPTCATLVKALGEVPPDLKQCGYFCNQDCLQQKWASHKDTHKKLKAWKFFYEAQEASLEEAVKLYTKSIKLLPDEPGLYFARASLLEDCGGEQNFELAITDVATAIGLTPQDASEEDRMPAFLTRARLLISLKRVDEAAKDLKVARDLLNSEQIREEFEDEIFVLSGDLAHLRDEYDEAVAHYEKALGREEMDAVLYVKLMNTHLKRKDFEKGVQCGSSALKLAESSEKREEIQKTIDLLRQLKEKENTAPQ